MLLMAYLSYMLSEVSQLLVLWKLTFFCFLFHSNLHLDFDDDASFNCTHFPLQLFNLSAILTVFFCGIVMSHYTWHNVTESSRVTTKYVALLFFFNIMFYIKFSFNLIFENIT